MSTVKVILVVDDSSTVRQGTVMTLRHVFGFETDEASDGLSALEKLKTSSYAAILMDCEMPRMDGFECAAHIRELERLTGARAPIIIGRTASVIEDIRERCLKAGMDDYLDKSCTAEEFRKMLVKWLEARAVVS